jgi:hypothetical protein
VLLALLGVPAASAQTAADALFFSERPPAASAQTAADALFFSERPPAASPRLMGMAGAGTAGEGDIGDFYGNPAGLAFAETSTFTGAFRGLYTTNRSSYETFASGAGGRSSFGVTTTDAGRTGYGLGNLGLLYKVPTVRGALVLGGTVHETRLFGRDLEFSNRNQLSSVTDFLLPQSGEVGVQEYAIGEAPEGAGASEGEYVVEAPNNDYVVDFDPDGDGLINRPLSLAAFETFAIDLAPSLFDPDAPAQSFLQVLDPGTRFRQTGDVTESGAQREIGGGGAVEAAKTLFVGISAHIHTGGYNKRDVFEEVDDLDENDGQNGTVAVESVRLTRRLDTDFTGFSARIGVSTRPIPAVRAGLTIETPTWYGIRETARFQLQTTFDGPQPFLSGARSATYGDDARENAGRTEFEYRLRTPWRFGAGLSVEVGPVQLSGDAMLVDWTQMRLTEVDGLGDFDDDNDRIEDDFRPVLQARVGTEVDLSPVLLRAGYAYHPAPISFADLAGTQRAADFFFGTGVVDGRSRTYLSGGLGYEVGDEVRLDLAWMQERFDDRTLPYNAVNASYVNEEVRRNQVRIGMTFRL